MTIRRNVDLNRINLDYAAFELACERTPAGLFDSERDILNMIGTQCDALLGTARAMGVKTCNCDGIREIEVLMFDMIRRSNPDSQIERAITLGELLENLDADAGDRLIQSIGDFYPAEVAELQQDGTWAIMSGGGFMKGGFPSENACEQAIDRRVAEALAATQ